MYRLTSLLVVLLFLPAAGAELYYDDTICIKTEDGLSYDHRCDLEALEDIMDSAQDDAGSGRDAPEYLYEHPSDLDRPVYVASGGVYGGTWVAELQDTVDLYTVDTNWGDMIHVRVLMTNGCVHQGYGWGSDSDCHYTSEDSAAGEASIRFKSGSPDFQFFSIEAAYGLSSAYRFSVGINEDAPDPDDPGTPDIPDEEAEPVIELVGDVVGATEDEARQLLAPGGDAGTGDDVDVFAVQAGTSYTGYMHGVADSVDTDAYALAVTGGQQVSLWFDGRVMCGKLLFAHADGNEERLTAECELRKDMMGTSLVAPGDGTVRLEVQGMLPDTYGSYEFRFDIGGRAGSFLPYGDAGTGHDIISHHIDSGWPIQGYLHLKDTSLPGDRDTYMLDASAGDRLQISLRSPNACYDLMDGDRFLTDGCSYGTTGTFEELVLDGSGPHRVIVRSPYHPSTDIPYRLAIGVNEDVDAAFLPAEKIVTDPVHQLLYPGGDAGTGGDIERHPIVSRQPLSGYSHVLSEHWESFDFDVYTFSAEAGQDVELQIGSNGLLAARIFAPDGKQVVAANAVGPAGTLGTTTFKAHVSGTYELVLHAEYHDYLRYDASLGIGEPAVPI